MGAENRESGLTEGDRLFGIVPADTFRALAGRSRQFYAKLLVFLGEEVFGYVGDTVSRKRAIISIGEFIARQERALVVQAVEDAGPDAPSGGAPQIAYDRLIKTGWLVEYPDRYLRVVDFDPAARLLLQALIDIESGRLRSYGGAVLNVVTLLRTVEKDLVENAIAVREAALAARAFMAHLKTVGSSLRQVEAQIMAQPSANALIKSFIDDFIQATVVQDYRNLHTRDSPFRFKNEILEIVDRLLATPDSISTIAIGVRRAGLHLSGETEIVEDLRSVARTFEVVDQHIAAIEETTFRIERRIYNVVLMSGRISPIDTAEIESALKRLGASGLSGEDELPIEPFMLGDDAILDARHFYLPHRREQASTGSEVVLPERDPALDLYHAALDEFEARIAVTTTHLRAYLDRAFLGESEITSDCLPIETLDDFLVLERIHEVGDPPLNAEFELTPLAGMLESDWISRRAFRLRRKVRNG